MSLAHYLALGKSIENVNGDGRYKVTGQPIAPDFTSGKGARKGDSNLEILNLFDQSQMPVESQPSAGGATAKRASATDTAETNDQARPTRRWLGGWKKALPPQERAKAVQRELALDMVIPVRNDLSDSDLEAVPVAIKMPTASAAETAQPFWRRWPKQIWASARGSR